MFKISELARKSFFVFFISFFVFFFSWFFVYKTGINDTAIQSEDTLPALFIPASISLEGNLDLDEYFGLLTSKYPQPDGGRVPFYLEEINGHFYSAFPVMTGVLATPVYFLPLQLGLPVNFETVSILGHLSASLMVAGSVVVMFLIFSKTLNSNYLNSKQAQNPNDQSSKQGSGFRFENLNFGNLKLFRISDFGFRILNSLRDDKALWLALVYAFGTCSFALTSQALWQHTASQLLLTLALYFLVLGFDEPKKAPWAGLFLSLATLARPTGGIVVIILSIYVFLRLIFYRRGVACYASTVKNLVYYILLGLTPLALFLLIPELHWGSFAGYSSQVGYNWTAPFPLGFLGEWFSPSKGMLIYSPVFAFSFVSVWLMMKGKIALQGENVRENKSNNQLPITNNQIFYWIFACVIVHSLVVGKWYHWYGGWAFGYRMMSDMMPFLAFLWVPFARSEYWGKFKTWFYLAAAWSVGIQLAGIAFFDGVWHNLFDEGPNNQAWLWSIKNSEMFYYVRRLIVKLQGKPTNLVR